MGTQYRLTSTCDSCAKMEEWSGPLTDESIELWRCPENWYHVGDRKSNIILCSKTCLHSWVLVNEGEEALESLENGVWLA